MTAKYFRLFISSIMAVAFLSAAVSCGGKSAYKYGRSYRSGKIKLPSSNVKLVVNDRVRAWLDYFRGPGRERFGRYLERSGRYTPLMREILREYNIPEDVVHIALIESGFSSGAYSRAHAVGFWQFIRSTGRHYNLRIDAFVDERRDPVKSTHAAARYLTDLYNMFGDWYLAFAAYNSGEGKVARAIKRYGTKDFWELTTRRRRHFKAETKDYVPKFVAATILAKDPKKYGFKIDYHKPLDYDHAEVASQTDFEIMAKCARVSYSEMADLNPELLMGVTPPGVKNYRIRVPKGRANRFHAALAKIPKEKRVTKVYAVATPSFYKVRRGDTISKIARKFRVSKRSLMAANGIRNANHLRIGKRLEIPGRNSPIATRKKSSDKLQVASASGEEGDLIRHTIRRGETINAIARRYGVKVSDIRRWNRIKGNRIIAGKKLKIYKNIKVSARSAPSESAGIEVASRVSTSDRVEEVKAAGRYTNYKVRRGDTLYEIARKNGTTISELCRINEMSRKAVLKPGMGLKLKVTTAESVSAAPRASERLVLSSSSPASESAQVVKYRVRKGDTAWGIAKKHNVSISQMEDWNNKTNLKKIKPGDIIKLKLASKKKT